MKNALVLLTVVALVAIASAARAETLPVDMFRPDLTGADAGADLTASPDLATGPDLTATADLAAVADLTVPEDLAPPPDLRPLPDLYYPLVKAPREDPSSCSVRGLGGIDRGSAGAVILATALVVLGLALARRRR